MKYIGKSMPKISGYDLVSGKGLFTADLKVPNMAQGRLMHSPYARAEIMSINTEKAEALRGVYAVVTYKDVPEDVYVTNRLSPAPHAKPLDKTVNFIGDVVAMVVAESEDIADEAIELIDIEYKLLPPVLTMDDALADGAPQLYESLPGNVAPLTFFLIDKLNINEGDVEKAFKECDYVVDMWTELRTGQNPLPLEAPVVIAQYTGDGMLFLTCGCACPSLSQWSVAMSLNMPPNKVRVDSPYVGGSFGSRIYAGNQQPLLFAALMAKKARRPVRLVMTKEEHFSVCTNRMNTKSHIRLGINKDVSTTGIEMRQWSEAGSVACQQANMMTVGVMAMPILVRNDNFKFDGEVVMTNRQSSGSFRGYGYLESSSMVLRALSRGLRALGIDPVDYFVKNALKHGERFYNSEDIGHEWTHNSGPDWYKMIQAGAEKFDWKNRFKGWGVPTLVAGPKRRGVGCGMAGQATVGNLPGNMDITIDAYGGVVLKTVMTEHGTGNRHLYRKMVAEELDLPIENIVLGDISTHAAPFDIGSVGCRGTCGGNAAVRACRDLKRKLYEAVQARFGVPASDLEFKAGVVVRKSNPEEVYPLHVITMDSFTGSGHWEGTGEGTTVNFQFVEVEVDTETGIIKIIDHLSATDAGCIVNPESIKNQLDGFYPGVDLALYEETIYDKRDNRVLNTNMIDYKTRTFNDCCKHESVILETLKGTESPFPFSAFGVGEPAISSGAPAVSMAVYNACGIELLDYPFLPGKVLAALKEKEETQNEKV